MIRSPLDELPQPPPGSTGWPWTEQTMPQCATMPDGAPWPRISVVTPSYNQGQFIEETIRSVLLQGYPNMEYIIMDGGSSDASVEIIRKYEPWLTYWVSERDEGQADALRAGFGRVTGRLLGWINSDDLLMPNALELAAVAWLDHDQPAFITGQVRHLLGGKMDGQTLLAKPSFDLGSLLHPWRLGIFEFQQPGSFFCREIYELAGGIDKALHLAMDYDLYIRMLSLDNRVVHLDQPLASFRHHPASKTTGAISENAQSAREHWHILSRYRGCYSRHDMVQMRQWFAIEAWHRIIPCWRRRSWRQLQDNLRFGASLGIPALFCALLTVSTPRMRRLLAHNRGRGSL